MQHEIDFSRKMLCIFYALNIVVETLVRNLIRMVLMSLRRRGLNQKQILLVGYSRAAEQYIDRIIANPQWGYCVRGILDDNVARGTMYKGIKVIGRIENLVVILPENCLDEIAITLGLGNTRNCSTSLHCAKSPGCTPNLSRTTTTSFRPDLTPRICSDFR